MPAAGSDANAAHRVTYLQVVVNAMALLTTRCHILKLSMRSLLNHQCCDIVRSFPILESAMSQ